MVSMNTFEKIMGGNKMLKDRDKVVELKPKNYRYYATGVDKKGVSFLTTDLSEKLHLARVEARTWARKNELTLDGVYGF
jgi:hypothetical protein